IYLALQQRGIAFSYRWFNGHSTYLKAFLPDYAPEFTIASAKVIIVIFGSFFGNIPSVIDRNALAKAILEREGWQVVWVQEVDLLSYGADTILQRIPRLAGAAKGGPLPHPLGAIDTMEQFRRMQAGIRRVYAANAVTRAGRASGPGTRARR